MTFGLLFKYAFAAALGGSLGILAVLLVIGIIAGIMGVKD